MIRIVKRGRPASLALYVAAAVGFAVLMILIGMLPAESTRSSIRLNSFGVYTLAYVGGHIFWPLQVPLAEMQLPEWFGYVMTGSVAALYSLLVTLPLYFFFRTGRRWLLALQSVFLAAHAAFALFVVAPFWIGQ